MHKRNDQGQAMIILIFALIAIMAMVGLAIDGGRNYTMRRQSQNAADAAAMAGTRELASIIQHCGGGTVGNDNLIAQKIVEFARANGVDHFSPDGDLEAWYVDKAEVRLGPVGTGQGIPTSATGIEVSTIMTETTTFMRLLGRETIAAAGHAMGMSGNVVQVQGGLLPIAVPLEVVEQLELGEEFNVLEDTSQHEGGIFCRDPSAEMCIGDPTSANAQRGWLNLNYIYNLQHLSATDPLNRSFEQNVADRICGPYPEKSVDDGTQGWCTDGCPYPFPVFSGDVGATNGDFIHGDPGGRQASTRDVVNTYNGEIVYVPVFDHIYLVNYMDDNFEAPQNPVPDGTLGGDRWPDSNGFLYHVAGFAAVKITDSRTNDHVLEGEFQFAMIGEGQIRPGEGLGRTRCEDWRLVGIQLWR